MYSNIFTLVHSVTKNIPILGIAFRNLLLYNENDGYSRQFTVTDGVIMKNMEKQKINHNMMSKKALVLWRLRISAAIIGAYFFVGAAFALSRLTSVILGTVFIVVYVAAFTVYCPILHRSYRYIINESDAEIQKGVFFRTHTQIKFSKVQYCVVSQGPLQRLFGLCSVRLLTAGSFETIRDISLRNGEKIKKLTE